MIAGIIVEADDQTEVVVDFETPEWAAVLDWLGWHGIDPYTIPAGTRVTRDGANRRICYFAVGRPVQPCPECAAGKHYNCDTTTWDVERDERADCPCARADHVPIDVADWTAVPMIEQGEAPPLPFPDVIARWLR